MITKKIFLISISVLVLLNTFFSVNQWSSVPLGNTTIKWFFDFAILFLIFWYKKNIFNPLNRKDYNIIKIYLVWLAFSVFRGVFVAENYWEWKQLISGTIILLLPIFVYVFSNPLILQKTLRFWFKLSLPFFLVFFFWVISPDAYHFYLGPVLLLSSFLPILKRKWLIVFLILLLLMIFSDFGARSQVIKTVFAFGLSILVLISKYLNLRILKFAHSFFYILPIILLITGIIGVYNPFKRLSEKQGKYTFTKLVEGETVKDDLAADTRTFIYVEVIESALKHNYILWGRTPARGNDSAYFGAHTAEELKTGKYERHTNEVCFPNVFTWLGLIGMLLYALIYLKSSYLALYKSNNIYMKIIGVFIAFRFTYGWVEDFNRFDIMNISLWMIIAMGFSIQFRKMNNQEFRLWINRIFR